ncbi:MAG: ribonuclease HI family protein [Deltaproteobacteria bacterium]|nr:ribonuclease HI family protein [Deltaproteobacteria bacterium]
MSKRILIHTDGAAKGNPGPAGIGCIACAEDGTVLFEHCRYIGETTNNVAEYKALIDGLTRALEEGASEVRVASDSELMVRQLHGIYRVKQPHLRKLFDEVTRLSRRFDHFEIAHIPREENREADALANRAIRQHNPARQNS